MIKVTCCNFKCDKVNCENYVYCGNWKCTKYECGRHHLKQPWNVPINTYNWSPDKKGECDGYYE